MRRLTLLFLITGILFSCKSVQPPVPAPKPEGQFAIAFGSCNRHTAKNNLWDDVLASNPNVWIWGGDIVYADTSDPAEIDAMYRVQKGVPAEKKL